MCAFLSRITLNSIRSNTSICFSLNSFQKPVQKQFSSIANINKIIASYRNVAVKFYSTDTIHPPTPIENATIPLKKKTIHKKPAVSDLAIREGQHLTVAYATAESYDLQGLKEALVAQKLYQPGALKAHEIGDEVLVATAVYPLGDEPRQILFFREGAVVFWNCSELEASNVLEFLKKYEVGSYPTEVVQREKEIMTYSYHANAKKCHLQDSTFVLVKGRDNSLEKYTFSHAMVQSARLGAWEVRLEALASSVRAHTALMERDGVAYLDKKEVVRKLGELFSLRHRLNVESDLLDTPDFYWEEEQLERLYSNTVAYFTISRRTRVLNERLSHCVELLELLSSWAADKHHVRLEWMVIALILAEVCFEILHLVERYVVRSSEIKEVHE